MLLVIKSVLECVVHNSFFSHLDSDKHQNMAPFRFLPLIRIFWDWLSPLSPGKNPCLGPHILHYLTLLYLSRASGDWHNHWRLAFYVGPPQNHQFNEWNDLNFHIFKNYNQPCHNDHPSTLLHLGVYEGNDLSGGKSGTNLGHKSLPSLTEKNCRYHRLPVIIIIIAPPWSPGSPGPPWSPWWPWSSSSYHHRHIDCQSLPSLTEKNCTISVSQSSSSSSWVSGLGMGT